MRRTTSSPVPSQPRPTTTPADAQVIWLAGMASDRAADLSRLCKAFTALERLVSPEYADEQDASLSASRDQLGELLYSLNGDLRRRVDALIDAMVLLHAQAQMNAACNAVQAR